VEPPISAANSPTSEPTARIARIGLALAPVIVIDDFHPDPHGLVTQAETHSGFSASSKFYPGVRARGTLEYVQTVRDRLQTLFPTMFGAPHDIVPTECNFSMVTLPPEETIPFQRIPHFDGTDMNNIAVLHYLCEPRHGGTAFYRHRSTGYEVITEANARHYAKVIDSEVHTHGVPRPAYVNGSTELFECIATFDAAFNRALVYRGTSLHSGMIPADFIPDPDPRTGRLTLNTFLQLRATP
jgi:hypothetical protein